MLTIYKKIIILSIILISSTVCREANKPKNEDALMTSLKNTQLFLRKKQARITLIKEIIKNANKNANKKNLASFQLNNVYEISNCIDKVDKWVNYIHENGLVKQRHKGTIKVIKEMCSEIKNSCDEITKTLQTWQKKFNNTKLSEENSNNRKIRRRNKFK